MCLKIIVDTDCCQECNIKTSLFKMLLFDANFHSPRQGTATNKVQLATAHRQLYRSYKQGRS